MHRPLFFISQFLNGLNELIGSDFYLPQDLSNERARQVSPRMPGQCRGSSIGMSIKNVAAFLSDSHKTHLEKYFLHGPEIHHRDRVILRSLFAVIQQNEVNQAARIRILRGKAR